MKGKGDENPATWESLVVMKPIELVARELESQGWQISWLSDAEALAFRGGGSGLQGADIVEFLTSLGVKLKKVGNEYMGLCPFHEDHTPSLSVNRGKGLWHCFGCGKGGDAPKLLHQWQALRQ